jgi:hypothetical protein
LVGASALPEPCGEWASAADAAPGTAGTASATATTVAVNNLNVAMALLLATV